MSKPENHWYLLGATISAVARKMRPGVREIAFGFLMLVLLSIAYEVGLPQKVLQWAGSPAFFPAFAILIFGAFFAK